jgi:hypothetical protein
MFVDLQWDQPHGKNAQEGGPAYENLRLLRTAFHLAQEMGQRLGHGPILFGQVPRGVEKTVIGQYW